MGSGKRVSLESGSGKRLESGSGIRIDLIESWELASGFCYLLFRFHCSPRDKYKITKA